MARITQKAPARKRNTGQALAGCMAASLLLATGLTSARADGPAFPEDYQTATLSDSAPVSQAPRIDAPMSALERRSPADPAAQTAFAAAPHHPARDQRARRLSIALLVFAGLPSQAGPAVALAPGGTAPAGSGVQGGGAQ